jgi:hypothetical protein
VHHDMVDHVVLGALCGLGAVAIDAGVNTYVATPYSAWMINWLHAYYQLLRKAPGFSHGDISRLPHRGNSCCRLCRHKNVVEVTNKLIQFFLSVE